MSAALLRSHGAGSTVISGGLGALGTLAATWLLAGATGSHALVLLGRTGRLRVGGGMFSYGLADQASLFPCFDERNAGCTAEHGESNALSLALHKNGPNALSVAQLTN